MKNTIIPKIIVLLIFLYFLKPILSSDLPRFFDAQKMATSPRPLPDKRSNDYEKDVNWVQYYNWFPRSIKWPLIKGHIDNNLATISLTFLFVRGNYRQDAVYRHYGQYGSPLYATYITRVSTGNY